MSVSQPAPERLQPASGRFLAGEHHFPVRVYFEDTDLSGIVYHANYLRFMERARSDMLRLAGIDQRTAVEEGEGAYAVTRLTIDYRRSARMEDDLLVVSRVRDVTGATVAISQDILRDNDLVTSGEVTVAFVSPTGRPKRQPRSWIALFEKIAQGEEVHS